MSEKYRITVINDTNLPVEISVYMDGCYKGMLQSHQKTVTSSCPESELRLYKDNLWENQRLRNRLFLFIYTFLNILSGLGRATEEDLPLKVGASVKLSELKEPVLKLSEYIQVNADGLRLWKKYNRLEAISICLLIILIVVGFSFLLHNVWLQVLLIAVFLLFDLFLLCSFINRLKRNSALLSQFVE